MEEVIKTPLLRHPCFTSPNRRLVCEMLAKSIVDYYQKVEQIKYGLTIQEHYQRGVDIERAVYVQNYNSAIQYCETVTRIAYAIVKGYSSIKDKSPAELVMTCLEVKGDDSDAVSMQLETKNSDELKQCLKDGPEYTKNMVNKVNADLVDSSGQFTRQISCNKCGSTKIMFNQKQTRSADEAMTVFASCTNCGVRWKM